MIVRKLLGQTGNAPLGFVMMAPAVLLLFLAVLQINQLQVHQIVFGSAVREGLTAASRNASIVAFDELQDELSTNEVDVEINQRSFGAQQLNIVRAQYWFSVPYVGRKLFQLRTEAISE